MNTLSGTIQINHRFSKTLLVVLLFGLAGLSIYREAVVKVMGEVINRSDSSHGVFVPLVSAYFVWTIRDRLQSTETGYSWAGIPLIVACLAFPLTNIGGFQIQFIAFIGFTCSLVLLFLGRKMLKMLAFPILFLITMTPLSPDLYDQLAEISRSVAFGGSLKILSWLGIPHMRVGWDIELPNAILEVATSCGGIRYLISFIVFGLAYAYLFRSTLTGRLLTVLATIPISFFASIWRLTIIFLMTYYVSPYWSQHKPHVVLSWFVFFTVLFSSVFIDQWVRERRSFSRSRKDRKEKHIA